MRKPQTQHCFEFPVLLLPQLSMAQSDSLLVIKPDHPMDGATMKAQRVFSDTQCPSSLSLRQIKDVCEAFADLHVKGIQGIGALI